VSSLLILDFGCELTLLTGGNSGLVGLAKVRLRLRRSCPNWHLDFICLFN
jgi:hypothetical protein